MDKPLASKNGTSNASKAQKKRPADEASLKKKRRSVEHLELIEEDDIDDGITEDEEGLFPVKAGNDKPFGKVPSKSAARMQAEVDCYQELVMKRNEVNNLKMERKRAAALSHSFFSFIFYVKLSKKYASCTPASISTDSILAAIVSKCQARISRPFVHCSFLFKHHAQNIQQAEQLPSDKETFKTVLQEAGYNESKIERMSTGFGTYFLDISVKFAAIADHANAIKGEGKENENRCTSKHFTHDIVSGLNISFPTKPTLFTSTFITLANFKYSKSPIQTCPNQNSENHHRENNNR